MQTDLLTIGIPVAEKIIRTVAVYGFLLAGLRLAGKRELGQLNPFDLVVLLLLSNTLQNAIIGNDTSLTGGFLGAATLLVLNYAVVRFLYTHPRIDRLLEGDVNVLIRNGHVLEHRLRRELITREELAAAARRQGLEKLEDVHTCRLEIGGALTFVPQAPTADQRRHEELLAAIAQLRDELHATRPPSPAGG